MTNSKIKNARVLFNGKEVKTCKLNSRESKSYLVHGVPDTREGKINNIPNAFYSYIIDGENTGVYRVHQNVTEQIAVCGECIANYNDIMEQMEDNIKSDNFLFIVSEKFDGIECIVGYGCTKTQAIKNPKFWTQKASNNGRDTFPSLCFRDKKEIMEAVKSSCEMIFKISAVDVLSYVETHRNEIHPNANNGHLGETISSGQLINIVDIFRAKKHDIWLKATSKSGNEYFKSYEVKTSLKLDCGLKVKADKSASNTNAVWKRIYKK